MAGEPAPTRRAGAGLAVGSIAAIAVLSVTAVMTGARLLPTGPEDGEADRVLPVGEVVERSLSGRPDRWVFTAGAGDQVTIEMRQVDDFLDPYLQLLAPSGDTLAEDDDSGGRLNARIRIELQEDGEHVLRAGGFGASRGTYQLTLRVQEAGAPGSRRSVGPRP
jgi:hypothetical protein